MTRAVKQRPSPCSTNHWPICQSRPRLSIYVPLTVTSSRLAGREYKHSAGIACHLTTPSRNSLGYRGYNCQKRMGIGFGSQELFMFFLKKFSPRSARRYRTVIRRPQQATPQGSRVIRVVRPPAGSGARARPFLAGRRRGGVSTMRSQGAVKVFRPTEGWLFTETS